MQSQLSVVSREMVTIKGSGPPCEIRPDSGKNTPRSQSSAEVNVHLSTEMLGRSDVARIQNIEYLVEKS